MQKLKKPCSRRCTQHTTPWRHQGGPRDSCYASPQGVHISQLFPKNKAYNREPHNLLEILCETSSPALQAPGNPSALGCIVGRMQSKKPCMLLRLLALARVFFFFSFFVLLCLVNNWLSVFKFGKCSQIKKYL